MTYPYPAPVYPVQPKSQPPSIALTVTITLIFGIFGLIPMFRHAKKARAMGRSDIAGKYARAFWITFAASFAVAALLRAVAGA